MLPEINRKQTMASDARSVANELIRRAHEENRTVTPMQVLKLTYLCHAWMLGLYGRPLIRQRIEAWMFGPVIGDVYKSLKRYGGSPIEEPISYGAPDDFDEYEEDLINQVWRKYRDLSGLELSAMTHAAGTPWSMVRQGHGRVSVSNPVIPDSLIRRHYEAKATESKHNS